jgi:hypothetical protein
MLVSFGCTNQFEYELRSYLTGLISYFKQTLLNVDDAQCLVSSTIIFVIHDFRFYVY